MARIDFIEVEIAYAEPSKQYSAQLRVPVGTTVRGVIERARLGEHFPAIDLATNQVGIFGELRDLDALVRAGDRVEIYRPVQCDPKVARRLRGRRIK
ncbi:MAG: RnfH family protein [Gammaproteobacteria bacterium]|nr:RnfH family protein [Gammaproteobacteria bacterium]